MTSHLEILLKDYGFVAAVVYNLDIARESWASNAKDDLLPHNHFFAEPEFLEGFNRGRDGYKTSTPAFLYNMCFIHAWGVFENYLCEFLTEMFRSDPIRLTNSGKGVSSDKEMSTIDLKSFLRNLNSVDKLLDQLIAREITKLAYKSTRDVLRICRDRYGFKNLTTDYDDRMYQLSLIRNCLVHNQNRVDEKLETASQGFYVRDRFIHVDRNLVSRSITTLVNFSIEFDTIARTLIKERS